MNTNTVEQAIRLKELGVREDYLSPALFNIKGFWNNHIGPALTLDELHRVFDWLADERLIHIEFSHRQHWFLSGLGRIFTRTTNHAEDWTVILIWLLGEGHVAAEQVNSILKGTE